MRKMSELLQVVKDNIGFLKTGLCHLTGELGKLEILNAREEERIHAYILRHGPKAGTIKACGYHWTSGIKAGRARWLIAHIEKLQKEGQ